MNQKLICGVMHYLRKCQLCKLPIWTALKSKSFACETCVNVVSHQRSEGDTTTGGGIRVQRSSRTSS